ncbi:putative oxidoreductase metal ion binding domain protein [metagenome]|uniref:Putative oxidoreductase metal ion binding domain protein n=1 Tax=metagenome TaxID=256318 RepID=A0A2P2BY95_9ZZZZ
MSEQVDVVVLGLGPGGETAAGLLGKAGLDVVAVDQHLVGGECPFYGCVPSKMMIAAAHTLGEARRVSGRAGSAEVRPDWAPVAARIRADATHDWDDTEFVERLERNGARFVRGRGRLLGPGRVEVTSADGTVREYDARRGVVLNTGTDPAVPPVDGVADTPFWTNRDIVQVTELPASLGIIGGGPIGVEFAQTFARFGVQVTLVEAAERILEGDEPEASQVVSAALAADGVRILTGAELGSVSYADGRFELDLATERVGVERLLVAAGRSNNLAGIGLPTVGVDGDAASLETDERMRVVPRLWAVGDITGKGAFTHVSNYQARVAVRDILGQDGPWADYRAVPRVTYTAPEVGAVGLTEAQAREAGIAVAVATADLGGRGWIAQEEGVVKLVADSQLGVLVGATTVGPSGGEMLSLLVSAVHSRIPISELTTMMYAYPTFHRAVETALHRLR